MIPIDDRGFLLGDGLFETLLVENGEPMFWDEHIARLRRGCAVLGLPEPAEGELAAAAAEAIGRAGLSRAALRLTWSAGSGGRGLVRPDSPAPRLVASAAPAPAPAEAAGVVTVDVRRNEASPASRLKTLSYLDNVLARRQALTAGADEALMLNTRGEVACLSVGNLFWVKDGILCTPALGCGVLDGVVRGRIIAETHVREVRVDRTALDGIDAAFLTNSLVGLRPIARLDGRRLGAWPELQQLEQAIFRDRRGRR